jgi:hypothetical protein
VKAVSADPRRERLVALAAPALAAAWGVPLDAVPDRGVAVMPAVAAQGPLAVRSGDGALLLARPEWVAPWERLAHELSVEQLFSIFGVYELARAALPQGVSPFGPVWCFLVDRTGLSAPPAGLEDVQALTPEACRRLPDETFWHCAPATAAQGFGLRVGGEVAALATVWPAPEGFWEIGVDVLPAAQGRGRGRAVTWAAARWILERAPLAYYTTGAFNIPSTRNALTLGFRHCWSVIKGLPGPFLVPPAPIGRPLPDVEPKPYWRDYPE